MKFSSRLPHEFQTNSLSLILDAKRREGVPVLDLTESNPTRAGIVYPEGFLSALSDPRAAFYEPEPFGLPAARELIAREYRSTPDRVVMTASTSEAYSWIFKLLCDPGDEVLVPRPSYPLFEYLAALESVVVRHYGLFYDHGSWCIDFHTLERSINDRTRAIVLVNPNNPTGHFIAGHEWQKPSPRSELSATFPSFPTRFFVTTRYRRMPILVARHSLCTAFRKRSGCRK